MMRFTFVDDLGAGAARGASGSPAAHGVAADGRRSSRWCRTGAHAAQTHQLTPSPIATGTSAIRKAWRWIRAAARPRVSLGGVGSGAVPMARSRPRPGPDFHRCALLRTPATVRLATGSRCRQRDRRCVRRRRGEQHAVQVRRHARGWHHRRGLGSRAGELPAAARSGTGSRGRRRSCVGPCRRFKMGGQPSEAVSSSSTAPATTSASPSFGERARRVSRSAAAASLTWWRDATRGASGVDEYDPTGHFVRRLDDGGSIDVSYDALNDQVVVNDGTLHRHLRRVRGAGRHVRCRRCSSTAAVWPSTAPRTSSTHSTGAPAISTTASTSSRRSRCRSVSLAPPPTPIGATSVTVHGHVGLAGAGRHRVVSVRVRDVDVLRGIGAVRPGRALLVGRPTVGGAAGLDSGDGVPLSVGRGQRQRRHQDHGRDVRHRARRAGHRQRDRRRSRQRPRADRLDVQGDGRRHDEYASSTAPTTSYGSTVPAGGEARHGRRANRSGLASSPRSSCRACRPTPPTTTAWWPPTRRDTTTGRRRGASTPIAAPEGLPTDGTTSSSRPRRRMAKHRRPATRSRPTTATPSPSDGWRGRTVSRGGGGQVVDGASPAPGRRQRPPPPERGPTSCTSSVAQWPSDDLSKLAFSGRGFTVGRRHRRDCSSRS